MTGTQSDRTRSSTGGQWFSASVRPAPRRLGHPVADHIARPNESRPPVAILGQDLESVVERTAHLRHPAVIIGEPGTMPQRAAMRLHQASGDDPLAFVTVRTIDLTTADLRDVLRDAADRAAGGTLFFEDLDDLGRLRVRDLCALLADDALLRPDDGRIAPRLVAACGIRHGESPECAPLLPELAATFDIVRMVLTPVRDRPADIRPIIDHLLTSTHASAAAAVSPEALDLLEQYRWPGNLDELERTVTRLLVSSQGPVVSRHDVEWFAPELVAHAPAQRPVLIPPHRAHFQPTTTLPGAPSSGALAAALPSCKDVAGLLRADRLDELEGLHTAVRAAVAFIATDFATEISAKRLAEAGHVSASHLAHLFKRQLGFTSKQLLNQVRIDHAKDLLLEQPARRITDIALAVGFGDLSHFLKMFRRSEGESPKEFRQRSLAIDEPDAGPE